MRKTLAAVGVLVLISVVVLLLVWPWPSESEDLQVTEEHREVLRESGLLTPAVEQKLAELGDPVFLGRPLQVPSEDEAQEALAKSRDNLEESLADLPAESPSKRAIQTCVAELEELRARVEGEDQSAERDLLQRTQECQATSKARIEVLQQRVAEGDEEAAKELEGEKRFLHFLSDFCYLMASILAPFEPGLAALWYFSGFLIDGVTCLFIPEGCRLPGGDGNGENGEDHENGEQNGAPSEESPNGWHEEATRDAETQARIQEFEARPDWTVIPGAEFGEYFLANRVDHDHLALMKSSRESPLADIEPSKVCPASGINAMEVLGAIEEFVGLREPEGLSTLRLRVGSKEYLLSEAELADGNPASLEECQYPWSLQENVHLQPE